MLHTIPATNIMLCLLLCSSLCWSQKKDTQKLYPPDEKTLRQIHSRQDKLKQALAELPKDLPAHIRADIEIFSKAGEWIVRHREWFQANSAKATLAVLDKGLARTREAANGKPGWLDLSGTSVVHGYRSRIDGSYQPYAIVYPAQFGKDKNKKWRLDIILHGRDGTLNEIKFLNQHDNKPAPKDLDSLQLIIYGRGNNAYRWAGEADVFEALHSFIKVQSRHGNRTQVVDPDRIVLRGFSMGGAGTWHLGLHHPSMFAVIQPGAGFTTTHGYIKGLPQPLPPYQEPTLNIYDALPYAENARLVPIVAYSGEKDGQKRAADSIEAELTKRHIQTMKHLIGPGLEHKFPPEWQKKAEAEVRGYVGPGKGRLDPASVKKFQFVTYTLKFADCEWVTLTQLDKHYQYASFEGSREGKQFTITTKNIAGFTIHPNAGPIEQIEIDGVLIKNPAGRAFRKSAQTWQESTKDAPAPFVKRPGLMGPLDEAFTDSFLCVRGTGTAWNEPMARASQAQLERFQHEWDKWMRGSLPVVTDKEVSTIDRTTKNLILFGDPGNNALIAEIAEKLPIHWSRENIEVAGEKFASGTHLPMLIYPNAAGRYTVLNSGHTFHAADFIGTNALLYPRLGDYAVVKPRPTRNDATAFDVIKAGLFNEQWQLPIR